MKNIPDRTDTSSADSSDRVCGPACSETGSSNRKSPKSSLWSGFLVPSFSVFDTHGESRSCPKKNQETSLRNHGWIAAVKRVMNASSMRRLHERLLGYKSNISNSISDIWLLGVCYKICREEPSQEAANTNGYAAFSDDFCSRILVTYRKGFVSIGDSKYTSDVNWGCMLRSSQMLVAQPVDQDYIKILEMFGDSEDSAFSIHNLLKAGEGYSLAPGSWVGPYAMCRTWETLARRNIEENELEAKSFPMAIYVVSGDEDGERGGAPVLCIEDASKHCSEFSRGQVEWSPMLLLVPLVLGLDKVNPRYLPLLAATFTFPQSLGILGGRPGASTYLIGVQDDKVFYLDPHEVQQAVNISRDNLEADTSSYHCNVIRQIPLDSIDPSLAIGFYCRDKDDFDDFCSRASELAAESDGAPLFTVTQTRNSPRSSNTNMDQETDTFEAAADDDAEGSAQDDWQLL
ncbi:cysteine protease ATG4-like isoform X2 [Rutidosis leptorrhynchoides]|uniref:cysteine protease ATG4-like isoform X2 n=1 Tax=Rutidosis leptorrhynchoides TaxID=125765 RepID=UPI003A9A38FE